MARKNRLEVRKRRVRAILERAESQQKKLENRKQLREEIRQKRMEEEGGDSRETKQLKRKAQRRLENEMARLARKGIKLVKVEDDEMDMDDSERSNVKRRRTGGGGD